MLLDLAPLIYGGAVYIRGVTETVGPASDAVVRRLGAVRATTEATAGAMDVALRQAGFVRVPAEVAQPVLDVVGRRVAATRTATEVVGPALDVVGFLWVPRVYGRAYVVVVVLNKAEVKVG